MSLQDNLVLNLRVNTVLGSMHMIMNSLKRCIEIVDSIEEHLKSSSEAYHESKWINKPVAEYLNESMTKAVALKEGYVVLARLAGDSQTTFEKFYDESIKSEVDPSAFDSIQDNLLNSIRKSGLTDEVMEFHRDYIIPYNEAVIKTLETNRKPSDRDVVMRALAEDIIAMSHNLINADQIFMSSAYLINEMSKIDEVNVDGKVAKL